MKEFKFYFTIAFYLYFGTAVRTIEFFIYYLALFSCNSEEVLA